jgi:TRAP-type C4-dicarboxylate transport system permease small subunit
MDQALLDRIDKATTITHAMLMHRAQVELYIDVPLLVFWLLITVASGSYAYAHRAERDRDDMPSLAAVFAGVAAVIGAGACVVLSLEIARLLLTPEAMALRLIFGGT